MKDSSPRTSTASASVPAPAEPLDDRFVAVDGCFNFRDLGGYPTRDGRTVAWRRLYRSDALHRATAEGEPALAALGLATVLDLRTPSEVERARWQPPADWSGRWLNLPVLSELPDWSAYSQEEFDSPGLAAQHYHELAHSPAGSEALRSALTALAEPGALPAVFHCHAGKDRTGILAAVLLGLLGVEPETVVEDYALSAAATARWAATIPAMEMADRSVSWRSIPPSMRGADAATMRGFLDRLEGEHGSVAAFAESIGVTTGTVEALRSALLTPARD